MSKSNADELEHLLGRWIRVAFDDGNVRVGRLGKPNYFRGYSLDMAEGRFVFVTSHVQKVEVIS